MHEKIGFGRMCVEFAVSVKQPRIPLAEFARRHAGLAVIDGGKIEFVRESHIERERACRREIL